MRAAWARASDSTRKAAFDGLAPTEPDLDQARVLIKEAGASGATLTVATSSIGQDASLLATAAQDPERRMEIETKLQHHAADRLSPRSRR